MLRVTLHHHGPAGVVEIDGTLDIVAGYDLRRVFGHALRSTTGVLSLDLSRVSAADDDGVAALRWCSEQAIAERRVLMWATCSRPLARDLRAQVGTVRAPRRPAHHPAYEDGSRSPSSEREPTPADRGRGLGAPASRSRENA